MDQQIIIDRLRERIQATGVSAYEIANKIGTDRGYINDYLTGKKQNIAAARLAEIAAVLGCDAAYLLGEQRTPQQAGGMRLAGSIDPGAWRAPGDDVYTGKQVPVQPDPRYPVEDQAAWAVFDKPGAPLDQTIVLTLPPMALHGGAMWANGDLLVVERQRGEQVRRSIYKVAVNAVMHLHPALAGGPCNPFALPHGKVEAAVDGDVKRVVGQIIRVIHLYG